MGVKKVTCYRHDFIKDFIQYVRFNSFWSCFDMSWEDTVVEVEVVEVVDGPFESGLVVQRIGSRDTVATLDNEDGWKDYPDKIVPDYLYK